MRKMDTEGGTREYYLIDFDWARKTGRWVSEKPSLQYTIEEETKEEEDEDEEGEEEEEEEEEGDEKGKVVEEEHQVEDKVKKGEEHEGGVAGEREEELQNEVDMGQHESEAENEEEVATNKADKKESSEGKTNMMRDQSYIQRDMTGMLLTAWHLMKGGGYFQNRMEKIGALREIGKPKTWGLTRLPGWLKKVCEDCNSYHSK